MAKKLKPDANLPILPIDSDLLINPDVNKTLQKLKGFEEIKIVYFGTPDKSALLLEKLLKNFEDETSHRFTIQAVVTSPDKPVGRKQTITPSEVAQVAEKNNIPILKPVKLNEEFIESHLSLLDSDLFIVASFGKLIPQSLLEIPKRGALNVHPSLLPKYRGASPIQNAILDGEKVTGITIIKMDAQMDHGPIVYQEEVPIEETDTFASLGDKLFLASADILIKILPDFISGKISIKDQDHDNATFIQLIKREEGYFEIDNPPAKEVLDRMIRAYYPWPGVWTRWNGKIVKFLPKAMIQVEGKNPVTMKDFLNGHPDFPLKLS